jgi:hypothetical protein
MAADVGRNVPRTAQRAYTPPCHTSRD